MTSLAKKSFYLVTMSYKFKEKAELYDIIDKNQIFFCNQKLKINVNVI